MQNEMLNISNENLSGKHLRTILDNTADGILILNSDGIILSYNKACQKIFGYSAEEIIGQNIQYLIPTCSGTQSPLFSHETCALKKDLSEFPLCLSIAEVIEGKEHFFVAILRDITIEKQHQHNLLRYMDLLERSHRELDDFVYIISHDLKEPVRGINGYAQFILEDYGDILGDDGKNKLQSLQKISTRMDDLIDKLLYFSRLDRIEISYSELDLNLVVADISASIEPMLKEKNAYIQIETPLPTIWCDQVRVGEVFRNLITNAIKYNDAADKLIRIGVMRDHPNYPNQNVFYVRDNGIGIDEKYFDSIFKMFKRLHGRDAYGGGTGAGLTITKKIINQHHGTIWLTSEKDKGSCFYFTINGKKDDL